MIPTLERLEPRNVPSGIDLVPGQNLTIDHSQTVDHVNEPGGAEILVLPGVTLTVAGGDSHLAGVVDYGDYLSAMDFHGGTVAITGATIGNHPDPLTPGNFFLSGGAQASVADTLFRANLYVGLDMQTDGAHWDSTTTLAVNGPVAFDGANLMNYGRLTLSADITGNGVLAAETGTVTLGTSSVSVGMPIATGTNTGAVLDLPAGSTLTAPSVVLSAPDVLQEGAGASVVTPGGGVIVMSDHSLPFAYFADSVVVEDLHGG